MRLRDRPTLCCLDKALSLSSRVNDPLKIICPECKGPKQRRSLACYKCCPKERSKKIEWPEAEELVKRLEVESFTKIALELGVSGTGLRKHIRRGGLEVPRKSKPKTMRAEHEKYCQGGCGKQIKADRKRCHSCYHESRVVKNV